jgi:hypothetical protein
MPGARKIIGAAPTKKPRKPDLIPCAIRAAVIAFGRHLAEKYAGDFASNPRLKIRVAQLMKSQLPPGPGRPGFADVTEAIRMLNDSRRNRPGRSPKEVWREIYLALIPDHSRLPRIERIAAENQLHSRCDGV